MSTNKVAFAPTLIRLNAVLTKALTDVIDELCASGVTEVAALKTIYCMGIQLLVTECTREIDALMPATHRTDGPRLYREEQ